MTRILFLFAFLLFSCGFVVAQGNANGSGNGNGGNSNGNPPAWSNSISMEVHILQEAQPFFEAQLGINLGQLIQAYRRGDCTIECVATNPPSQTFRVRLGGHDILVIIDGA